MSGGLCALYDCARWIDSARCEARNTLLGFKKAKVVDLIPLILRQD